MRQQEFLSRWLRSTYDVREPKRPYGLMAIAFDKETGEEVARWRKGGRVSLEVWQRYLDETPVVRKWLQHEKLHEDPRVISLR